MSPTRPMASIDDDLGASMMLTLPCERAEAEGSRLVLVSLPFGGWLRHRKTFLLILSSKWCASFAAPA